MHIRNSIRKCELYTMEWAMDNDLNRMSICGAPYGGPMAMVRDFKQLIEVTGTAKPIIQIFSASGQLLSTINVLYVIIIYTHFCS